MAAFRLEPHEQGNQLWLKLKEQLELALNLERENNDHHAPADFTAMCRGRIEMLKLMLEWGEPAPENVDPPQQY